MWRESLHRIRAPRAAKAALAACLASLVVIPLGGVADEYPYYAPLGAVIAVSTTVAGSIRESVQGVAAILVGALLALAVTPIPQLAGLALVVAGGTMIGGGRWFGEMGGWVPLAALFVLIIGQPDPVGYVVAYLGLTGLGAAIGIAVNSTFPPLPLSESHSAIDSMRGSLVRQLSDLAAGLREQDLLTVEEWQEKEHALSPIREKMRFAVAHASEARRANWRARRWRKLAYEQYDRANALEHLAFLVEDIAEQLMGQEIAGRDSVALGPQLRPPTASVLESMASVLDSMDGAAPDPQRLRQLDTDMGELVGAIRRERQQSEDDLFTAGGVVIAVRRALSGLTPDDMADELPSRG